jgi:hypothetical protein
MFSPGIGRAVRTFAGTLRLVVVAMVLPLQDNHLGLSANTLSGELLIFLWGVRYL